MVVSFECFQLVIAIANQVEVTSRQVKLKVTVFFSKAMITL